MRIKGFNIDGFGIFHDSPQDDIPRGLVVICGKNESGKTTLYQFFRQMLFGLVTSDKRSDYYPPLRGGTHGGFLNLTDTTGDSYRIARLRRTKGKPDNYVILPDDSRGDESDLDILVPPGDRPLFATIFSFDIDELSDFASLDEEKMRSAIFGAAMGVRGVSLSQIDSSLKSSSECLFKKGGTKPVVNERLSEAKSLMERTKVSSEEIGQYDDLSAEIDSKETDLEDAKKRLSDMCSRHSTLDSLIKAYEHYSRYESDQSELEATPTVESFPEGGLEALESLCAELARFSDEINDVETEVADKQEELKRYPVDELIIDNSSNIVALRDELARYSGAVTDLPGTEAELGAENENIAEDLAGLGSDWSEEKLLSFDLSIVPRDELETHRQAIRAAESEASSCKQVLRYRQEDLRLAQEENLKSEEALNGLEKPRYSTMEEIGKARSSLREISGIISSLGEKRARTEQLHKRLEDYSSRSEFFELWGQRLGWAALLSLVVGLGAGFLLLFVVNVAAGLATGLIMLLAFLCAFLGRSYVRRESEQDSTRADAILSEISSLEQAISTLEVEAGSRASEIGVQNSSEAVETTNRYLDSQEDLLEKYIRAQERLELAAGRLKSQEKLYEEERERFDLAVTAFENTKGEWTSWLVERNLSSTLSPEGAASAFELISRSRVKTRNRDRQENRVKDMQSFIEGYVEKTAQALEDCGRTSAEPLDCPTEVRSLVSLLEEAVSNRDKAKIINQSIEDIQRKKTRLKSAISETQEKMAEILAEAKTTTEDEFREKGSVFNRRLELESQISEHRRNIGILMGPECDLDATLEALASSTKDELVREISSLGPDINALETAITEESKSLWSLTDKRGRLVSREDLAVMQSQLESLKAAIEREAAEWSRAIIVSYLLDKAKKQYQETRQPEVVREAVGFFSGITAGRFNNIVPSLDADTIEVDRSSGRSVSTILRHLSEKFREQSPPLHAPSPAC
ncbi:MAG: hypothetical protein CVV33_03980 [Methanomicrobiales archaeon HGW-Methanomicrobiales-4]|nr:MAG: hypothetical protein CVV33_03980 [Methanomicrobiales archaeon HGW-Methanomicrobiales-4]